MVTNCSAPELILFDGSKINSFPHFKNCGCDPNRACFDTRFVWLCPRRGLTLTALRYCCINHEDQGVFFQFEIIINVLVSSFCFIRIFMLWVYGHYKYLSSFSANIVLIRQYMTSTDVRFWRIKTISPPKGLTRIWCLLPYMSDMCPDLRHSSMHHNPRD